MKFVNPDGSIGEVPEPEKWKGKYRTVNKNTRLDSEPFRLKSNGVKSNVAICGSPKKVGGICHLAAGQGTNHKGYGRCWKHSGNLQEIGRGALRWSNLEMETFPGILKKANDLRLKLENDDYFNLREHIILMEAIAMTILEKAKTMEDLGAVIQYMEKCTKVIQRLDEIEHGRKLVIDYQGVSLILAKVEDAVKRYVPDHYTQDLIARALTGVVTEGFGGETIPGDGRPALIEGVAVEDRSSVGKEN